MIKWFFTDVDGCLTDGMYLVNENGIRSKTFFTRDFHGLMLLDETKVEIGIITTSTDLAISYQCERVAKYANVISGAWDKVVAVNDAYSGVNLNWDHVAYIGDDILDIPLLESVGLPACPADAHDSVKKLIVGLDNGMILSKNGGKGCVRELVDIVMEINDVEN